MAQVQLRMIYGYKMSSQTRSQKTSLARPQGAVALTAYQAILAQRHPNTNHVIQVTMIALLMSSTLPISALGHIPPQQCINQDCAILSIMKPFSKPSEGVLQHILSIVSLQTWVLSAPYKWGIISIA